MESTERTVESPLGIEDVIRSVRTLARRTRELAADTANVAERELAMAVRLAADLRDQVISKEMLAEVRANDLASRLRRDAHDSVDLFVDVGTATVLTATRFLERFVDEPRPAMPRGTNPADRGGDVIVARA